MNELKKHGFLLSIIIILIIIKFIIVPVFDWQSGKLSIIRLLEKKQLKVEKVLANQKEYINANESLVTIFKQIDSLFSHQKSESAFKLTQQQTIEKLLAQFNLKSQNIGWKGVSLLESIQLKRFQVEIHFKGKSIDVINFIVELEKQPQWIDIIDFNLSVKGQKKDEIGSMDGRININMYNYNSVEYSLGVRQSHQG